MALNNGILFVLMVEYFIINALPIINMTKSNHMKQKQVHNKMHLCNKKYVSVSKLVIATYVNST